MKVINFVTQMEAGGAQGAAIRMSEQMRLKNIESETWFIFSKSDTYLKHEKIKVLFEDKPKGLFAFFRVVYVLYSQLRLSKPNGIVCYTHDANMVGGLASLLAGIDNRVATLRNPVERNPIVPRLFNMLFGSIGVFTSIIAVSKTVSESCSGYPFSFKKRLDIVYNGLSSVNLDRGGRRGFKASFGVEVPEGNLLLLNVGRLHSQKNQEFLIDLMAGLPNCNLVIAGKGELEDTLRSKISTIGLEDRIHLIGEVKPNQVRELLSFADIFLFPSVFEAFGFALVEAALSGLPLIVSNIPSNREILGFDDGSYAGLVVEDFTTEKWACAIQELSNTELREYYGELAKRRALSFGIELMADKYIQHSLRNGNTK